MLTITAVASMAFAATASKSAKENNRVLAPGTYSAKVKALVCGGCASFIQETLAADKAIESATVNSEDKTVTFTVKPGAGLVMASLQNSLDASARQMGMGADYGLSDVKETNAKAALPAEPAAQPGTAAPKGKTCSCCNH